MPCLYYGDELGMGDWPGLRDRDPNRTPMAWTPARNGGFHGPIPAGAAADHCPGYDYRVVNVEVQKQLPVAAELASADADLPATASALRHGDLRLLPSSHPGVLVYVRSTEAMTVLVAANVTAAGARLAWISPNGRGRERER